MLAGLFAVHLVAGYMSNLMFAVAFLAACATLGPPGRRATVAAALVLGGGGLAHPQFWVPGAAILVLVAAWALLVRHDGEEFARLAWTVGGAGALVVTGLLSMLIGPARLSLDTSRDGFLRRTGLADVVRSAYVDRFVHRWTRYVQWISLPLAALGYLRARGTGGRILRAWLVVIVVGIPVGLLTGLFPADRLITFGYAVPILAGFGTVRLYGRLAGTRVGPRFATAGCALLVVAMAAGSFIAWHRQDPFIDETQTRQLEVLNRYVAAAPAGTPIVVVVDPSDVAVTFRATTTANVVRAAVPPGRAADVFVLVPPFEGGAPTPERARLTDVTSREIRTAVARTGGRAIIAELARLPPAGRPGIDRADRGGRAGRVAGGNGADPGRRGGGPAATFVAGCHRRGVDRGSGAPVAGRVRLGADGDGRRRRRGARARVRARGGDRGVAIALERAGVPLDGSVGPTRGLSRGGRRRLRVPARPRRPAGGLAEPPAEVEE